MKPWFLLFSIFPLCGVLSAQSIPLKKEKPQESSGVAPESLRLLTQEELDALRKNEQSVPVLPAVAVPPIPEEKPVEYCKTMKVVAIQGYWAAVPEMAFLHAPEKLLSKLSSEEVESSKKPKPVFVTRFPGPFYTLVRTVEVKREGSGYVVEKSVLEQLRKFDDSFVIAVEKGVPVRMPVVVR